MILNYYMNTVPNRFRSKFSTEAAFIDVTEYIINGFDSGEPVRAVMLDLKNTFDTVDSKTLQKN